MKMTMEQAFDEWIRKYEEDPERFQHIISGLKEYKNRKRGKASGYGTGCASTLNGLMTLGNKYWATIGL